MRATLIIGMVAPYRVAVLQRLTELLDGGLRIIACTRQETGRQWQVSTEGLHVETLTGVQVPLGHGFVMHFNAGVLAALRRHRPDVVCLTGFTPTMALASAYARMARIPYVMQVDSWAGGDPRARSPLHRHLRRFVTAGASAGIAVGEKNLDWQISFGLPADRMFRSPLVPAWEPPASVPGYAERPFDLLWCGALAAEKGVAFFVDLAEDLLARRGSLSVRIVGNGPRRDWCEQRLRAAGISVQFDGFLEGEALRGVYLSARLLAFPTRIDAWGLVATEAAQCGVPVLISPFAGAAGEVVVEGVNGRVLPLDGPSWAAAAEEILDQPATWSRFSAAGRALTASISAEASARGMFDALARAQEGASRRRRTSLQQRRLQRSLAGGLK